MSSVCNSFDSIIRRRCFRSHESWVSILAQSACVLDLILVLLDVNYKIVVVFVSDLCPKDEAALNKDSSNCLPGRTRFCFKSNCKR